MSSSLSLRLGCVVPLRSGSARAFVPLSAPPLLFFVRPLSTVSADSAGAFNARRDVSVFPDRRVGVNSAGAKVERPISPHVTIYSQPIPAISSITNRVTGVLLSIGLGGAAVVALTASCDLPSYVAAFQHSAPALVPVVKAIVAWPLVYHTLAGVRHLVWDYTARGMDLSSVELSSKLLLASSVVLAVAAAAVTIGPNPRALHAQPQPSTQRV
jgi:succinate dehydrogenase cytochrome b556 subunit